MADEELAPDEELEPIAAPVEEAEPIEESPEPSTVDALAAEMGWVPQDQFRGNPEDWKPADEFIRHGKEINRNLSRDLKDLRGTVENMSRTAGTLLEQQLAERDAYWQAKRNEAIEMGDREAVDHADTQRQALRERAQPSSDPVIETWLGENRWMDTSPKAAATAWGVCQENQHLPHAEQLKLASAEVQKRFPELFANGSGRPAPAVARPGSRSTGASGRKKSFHDLPAEAQAVARDMHDRLGIPTDTYVANYFKDKEKVG